MTETKKPKSALIGRSVCPECGFHAAHIKQSEKCLYRYCPECHSQHHARTEGQKSALMAKTRPEGSATATPKPEPVPAPTPSLPTPTPTPKPAPAPVKGPGYGGLLGLLK